MPAFLPERATGWTVNSILRTPEAIVAGLAGVLVDQDQPAARGEGSG